MQPSTGLAVPVWVSAQMELPLCVVAPRPSFFWVYWCVPLRELWAHHAVTGPTARDDFHLGSMDLSSLSHPTRLWSLLQRGEWVSMYTSPNLTRLLPASLVFISLCEAPAAHYSTLSMSVKIQTLGRGDCSVVKAFAQASTKTGLWISRICVIQMGMVCL